MIFERHSCRLGETIYPLEKLDVEIVVFHGRTLHLLIRRAMDEPMRDALDAVPRAMLMYEDGARFRAQRGLVFNTGEEDVIGFISADRFVDGNRREFSRAPLPTSTKITTSDAQGNEISSWSGQCLDISAVGIRVHDRGQILPAAVTQVEISLPGGNSVNVTGVLAWKDLRSTAFTLDCSAEDQNLIGELVARWHRLQARGPVVAPAVVAAA